MQEVLAHPNDIKATNNGVAFIKKIDQWNAVVVSVEKAKDGKIIWHKSFYDQKKEIYKNRPCIMKRGLSADATPSINPANKAFGSKRSISALDNPNAKIENISDIDVNKGENLSEGSKISFQFIGEHRADIDNKSQITMKTPTQPFCPPFIMPWNIPACTMACGCCQMTRSFLYRQVLTMT